MELRMQKVIKFLIAITVAIKAAALQEELKESLNDMDTTPNPLEYEEGLLVTEVDEPLYNNNESRINGGETVKKIVSYQVSLQTYRRNRWRHFCGGSIISPHHVLTAAHCVNNLKTERIHIVAGTLKWATGGDRHRVLSKHQHPQFSMRPKIINDIALLKVSPSFHLHKSTVGTISLGTANRVGENVKVQITGWGATTPTAAGGLANDLQQLTYETLSNAECTTKGFKVTSNELCALASKGKGACVGDSGGPLVTTQIPPQLVGIVSYGTSTCAQGIPDVYTRVSTFVPYIKKVISSEIP